MKKKERLDNGLKRVTVITFHISKITFLVLLFRDLLFNIS